MHLDGGYESTGDIRAEQRGHVQLPHVFLLSQGAGDALLAQELQAGHPVLHPHHVQRRPTRQEQARVPVTPANGSDGSLKHSSSCHRQQLPLSLNVISFICITRTSHTTDSFHFPVVSPFLFHFRLPKKGSFLLIVRHIFGFHFVCFVISFLSVAVAKQLFPSEINTVPQLL